MKMVLSACFLNVIIHSYMHALIPIYSSNIMSAPIYMESKKKKVLKNLGAGQE